MNKHLRHIFAAMLGTAILSLTAGKTLAAPPGWELRNGSWVPLLTPTSGTPEGQVAEMIRALETGRPKDVIEAAPKWIKANHLNPLMPQVLLLEGDANVAIGNKYRALFSYEDLLNNYPTSELYPHVLDREYNLADAFLNGYKRKFLGIHLFPVQEDGLELLDRIQDRQRGSPLAERAGMRSADYYYSSGKFPEAVDAYSDFLKRYPYSQYVRKAEIRRAEAHLANFRGVLFDFTPLYDARERLAVIAETYPQSPEQLQTKAIDDRIYQLEGAKELEIARYYWRAGRKHASGFYYKRVIANWPDTEYAVAARKEIANRMPQEAGE